MRQSLRAGTILIAVCLLLLQFNNCDVYSENPVFAQNELALSCLDAEDSSCFESNLELLEIRINTQNDLPVTRGTVFTLSGDCNEGGFPSEETSITVWGYPNPTSRNAVGTAPTTCQNGRFSVEAVIPVNYPVGSNKIEVEIRANEKQNPYESLGRSSIYVIAN